MKKISGILLTVSGLLLSQNLLAKENIGVHIVANPSAQTSAKINDGGCSPSDSKIDLDINNVRTKILGGGDMWWDLNQVKYEIPKNSKKHSLFAGSLWIGGFASGTSNLKEAAMTYRQNGNDFWPGPLDTTNGASVSIETCTKFDKHFVITRKEVEDFANNRDFPDPTYIQPASITDWPGNGEGNQANYLAPFYDSDGDGEYNPDKGDYPGYSLSAKASLGDCKSQPQLFGDKTIWWVFNDKGNIHSETDGEQVGLEIRAQAFAFATNDEINNMTFYQYQIFNRSSIQLDQCYMGMWVDPDLGNPDDDFIGCDVARGLGYAYNGDPDDEGNGENHYGVHPPAIGIDYFQGPLADPNGIADPLSATFNGTGYGDTIVDNERLGMEKFIFYKNDFSLEGNPSIERHYYNYLIGKWKDNNPITYGGSGHLSGGPNTNFMFPGDTDPLYGATNPWYSTSVADGRFIHSSGPFTLAPGAVNFVTIGAVWAQSGTGGPLESVELMKTADDKAQRLFDNCFKVVNGPDSPDLTFRELDQEIIVYLKNRPNSNNYLQRYNEIDPGIITPKGLTPRYDSVYRFQGYQLFQLKNASVSTNDIHDPDLARPVTDGQCDIKDGVATLINFKIDQSLNANVGTLEVAGADKGLFKSVRILNDMFTGARLINNKTYYYIALAYAYNNYKHYDQLDPLFLDGQKAPYKAGRNNIFKGGKPYTIIPHIPAPQNFGTVANSFYGQQPQITRIEGQGNGGLVLDLTNESEEAILADSTFKQIKYQVGKAPIIVKIIDPLAVPAGDFTIKLIPPGVKSTSIDSASWILTNVTTGEQLSSDTSISIGIEQLTDWGLSVKIEQSFDPGSKFSTNLGYLESDMTFADPEKRWLSSIPDFDAPAATPSAANWIRCGNNTDDYSFLDPGKVYQQLIPGNVGFGVGGTWAPYRLCSQEVGGFSGPAWKNSAVSSVYDNKPADTTAIKNALNKLSNLASVDVVITADKSKWTRCVVLEMCENATLSVGNAKKFDLRKQASVDKEGNPDASQTLGMSWFPGYAINIETGERLNMAFGEDTHFDGVNDSPQNALDMIWNPKDSREDNRNTVSPIPPTTPTPVFGGKHYIYVFGHNNTELKGVNTRDTSNVPAYDACNFIYNKLKYKGVGLTAPKDILKQDVYKDAMWVNIPILAPNQTLLACDVRIRLRVTKPFENNFAASGFTSLTKVVNVNGPRANPALNNNYPMYSFNTNDFAVQTYSKETAINALNLIQVVPNPYYGFSEYETNQVDNEVKITNLPQKCVIKIYTVNGTLIREFKKDESKGYLNWDLKNQVGIPIASGAYILHIDVPNVGEKVVKWFGALRPLDLDSY